MLIPIDMMDAFITKQSSSYNLLHYDDMQSTLMALPVFVNDSASSIIFFLN